MTSTGSGTPAQPNILLIVSDQHRLDCVGASNDYPVSTPNLDALAAAGVWFSSAYTPIPLCTPARQALLTGLRPEVNGTLWNYDAGSHIPALSPDSYSWPRELGAQGYRSHYAGKWHVNPDHDPTAFGYDEYVSMEDYDRWRAAEQLPEPASAGWAGSVDPVTVDQARTHWLAQHTVEFIQNGGDGPWHARIDFVEPHLPCHPVTEFADRYAPEDIPPWRNFADPLINKPYIQRQQLLNWEVENYTWDDWAPIVAKYYAAIAQMDDAVGRVLAALEASGEAENTIVIYTTDHGDMNGSHRMMDKHYVMYDDVVRVPLIMRWPGVIEPASQVDAFAYNMLDLPATITSLVGATAPPHTQGAALFDPESRPLTPSAAVRDRTHVVSTYNGQQFGLFTQRMLRTRDWKYVWNPTDLDELYDLHADPEEFVNVIGDEAHTALIADLRRRLYDHLSAEGDSMIANEWLSRQLLQSRKLEVRD